jgi:carboxymethylenebutenolidase
MCYSIGARPPLPPIEGGLAAETKDLTLTAKDGNRFMAFLARAASPTGAGMVILPDVRGLHSFYKELAERFAETGIDSVAFDYFGRTAGIGARDDSFEYRSHVEKTVPESIDQDVAAAIACLRSEVGGSVRSVFTVGFCFGGSNSWRQSATQPGLAGAIGFYGRPSRVQDVIARMKAPLLLLIAGADQATPQEEFKAFDRQLADAGVPHKMVVYPGAPHSFFDRSFAQHKEACDDAWRQVLAFVTERAAQPAEPRAVR